MKASHESNVVTGDGVKKGKDVQQIPLSGAAEEEILSRLSERVERAVESIQRLRKERDELRNRL